MQEISELSKEYGFRVIEDASHALGGNYKNKKVGSCEFSDMAIFSFHPVKMITTGEGGAITTNDPNLDEKVSLLRTHGITKDAKKFEKEPHGDWYYEQKVLGYNYRLTDMQAALGISQLKRLDKLISRRKEIARFYLDNLKEMVLPFQHHDTNSSWHYLSFKLKTEKKFMKI